MEPAYTRSTVQEGMEPEDALALMFLVIILADV